MTRTLRLSNDHSGHGGRLHAPRAALVLLEEAPSDDALIARTLDGDPRAFRTLVERYEGTVAAVVIGMLGPGAEADDVGQDTFVRFYRSMDRFRGEASLRTYLTRIAMNLSLNALKRRRRATGRQVRLEDRSTELVSPDPGPGADVESGDRRRAVRAAIDGLDDPHRAVVTLRMLEGLSTRETAQALGVPEGTVLSRLARARKKLESTLERWMNDDD